MGTDSADHGESRKLARQSPLSKNNAAYRMLVALSSINVILNEEVQAAAAIQPHSNPTHPNSTKEDITDKDTSLLYIFGIRGSSCFDR